MNMVYHCTQLIGFLAMTIALIIIYKTNKAALQATLGLPPLPTPEKPPIPRQSVRATVAQALGRPKYRPLHVTTLYVDVKGNNRR